MVLAYYGVEASEDELCKLCKHTFELGCDDHGMKNAIESFGLSCEIYDNQTLEDIKYWLSYGMPVIVDWFTGGVDPDMDDTPNGHSGVIVGLDDEHIQLLDPESGTVRNLTHESFLRCWFDFRTGPMITSWDDMVIRQLIVAYPPSQSAVSSNKRQPKIKVTPKGPSL